ncbi:hypothetical protein Bca101_034915 [Brassica carinata]
MTNTGRQLWAGAEEIGLKVWYFGGKEEEDNPKVSSLSFSSLRLGLLGSFSFLEAGPAFSLTFPLSPLVPLVLQVMVVLVFCSGFQDVQQRTETLLVLQAIYLLCYGIPGLHRRPLKSISPPCYFRDTKESGILSLTSQICLALLDRTLAPLHLLSSLDLRGFQMRTFSGDYWRIGCRYLEHHSPSSTLSPVEICRWGRDGSGGVGGPSDPCRGKNPECKAQRGAGYRPAVNDLSRL